MKHSKLKIIVSWLAAISMVAFYYFNHNKKVKSQEFIDKAKKEYEIGNLNSAKTYIFKYSNQYELNSNTWAFLGIIYLETANLDSSKIAYKNSLKLNPDNDKSLVGMGMLSRLEKDFTKAQEYYSKALKVEPNNPNILSNLIVIYLKIGEFKKAVEAGEQALQNKPVRLGVKGNVMMAYHFNNQLKKRDEIIQELKNEGYSKLDNLMLIINGHISLEDF